MKLEGLQRTFTARINNQHKHHPGEPDKQNYWQRLIDFNLYSIERRLERYQMIYTWKILEGQITPPKTEAITPSNTNDARTGRKCIQHHLPSRCQYKVKTLHYHSISQRGARLFNHLPKQLRNITGVKTEVFKRDLDRFLSSIPDQPGVPGYTAARPATSNSITAQLEYMQQCQGWRQRRGPASTNIEGVPLS